MTNIDVTAVREPDEGERRTTVWAHVYPPTTIRNRTGVWWIMDRDGGIFHMVNAATGREVTGTPRLGDLVRVLHPDDADYVPHPDVAAADRAIGGLPMPAQADLATAMVQVTLGAHVMATQDPSDPEAAFTAPATDGLSDRQLAAHLWIFHRLERTDIPDLAIPPERTVLHGLHASRRDREPHRHDAP